METLLWLPLRRTDWRRSKGQSEDTWKRMESRTSQSILNDGLTLPPLEILILNRLKTILFSIGTTASISKKTEKIRTGVAFLIYFQKNFLKELTAQRTYPLTKMKMKNILNITLKNTRKSLVLIEPNLKRLRMTIAYSCL